MDVTTNEKLPADPDGMNDERADWAASALEAFQSVTGTEPETALTDLLCDLMHWCDRNVLEGHDSFDGALTSALRHYRAETDGETAGV